MKKRCAAVVVLAAGGVCAPASQAGPDISGEVFYQIMPIAWRDSNSDANRYGDFGGLTASLDYLQQLGITSIYLQPIFPSAAYHGYQHGDASQLNSWFGTEPQFLAFVQATHARGMKVYLDYVAYGISQNSVWYQSAHNNPSSQYDLWLAFTNAANSSYTGSTYTTWSGASVGFIHWNLANAGPVTLNKSWAKHWLDPNNDGVTTDGVDGFRLDHAYSSAPEGWGATISFWQDWAQALRQTNPNVFIFCEPGDWGNYGSDLMTPTGFDGVITKPWEFAARNALTGESASQLYSSTAATLAAQPAGKSIVAEINDHDSDRLASALGASIPKHKVAAAILMTQPFPPNIYYGDEIGMRGTKNTSYTGDAADIPMREPFKWSTVAGPPMSNYFAANPAAFNGRVERDNDGRSVQEQSGVPGSLLEEYKKLIALRKGSAALKTGAYTAVTAGSDRIWSFLRTSQDQTLLVTINLYSQSVTTTLDLSGATITGGSTTPLDLLTNTSQPAITNANRAAYSVTIPAYGYRVMQVDLKPAQGRSDLDGRNIPTDFSLDGKALALQTAPTSYGDNVAELDQLFARAEDGYLALGITGNLPGDATAIGILLDTGAGGQNILSTANAPNPPAGVAALNGTRMDAAFSPDTLLWVNAVSGSLFVDQFTLQTAGGVVKTYRGRSTLNSGNALLSGGVNPNGFQGAFDTTNTAGVTGASAAGAAGAVTGLEILIPFADLGVGASCTNIGIAAFIANTSGQVGSQWLPGAGTSAAALGTAPNLAAIAGDQFTVFKVNIPGDINQDGGANVADFSRFLALYSLADPRANCDGSTAPPVLNVADFACFLQKYAQVCP